MLKKIIWSELTFPPINLYSLPKKDSIKTEDYSAIENDENKNIDNKEKVCYHTQMKCIKQNNNKNIGGGSGS